MTYKGVRYDEAGGFEKVRDTLIHHARTLPPVPEWSDIRQTWPKIAESASEDVAEFLSGLKKPQDIDRAFNRRLPWLGYLGATAETLYRRQAFFFGYANLWTTSNAYVVGGAQAFAPLLQNTLTDTLLDAAVQWKQGAALSSTRLMALGKSDEDDEPQDRSHYSAVVEVYGFLNLERAPFYNSKAEKYGSWFDISDRADPHELTAQVGQVTENWLVQNPQSIGELNKIFREAVDGSSSTRVEFENVELTAKKKINAYDELWQGRLVEDLAQAAKADLNSLGEERAAQLMLHLLLDTMSLQGSDPEGGKELPGALKSNPR